MYTLFRLLPLLCVNQCYCSIRRLSFGWFIACGYCSQLKCDYEIYTFCSGIFQCLPHTVSYCNKLDLLWLKALPHWHKERNSHYSTITSSWVLIWNVSLVDLEVSRGGAVLPAAQRLDDSGATQGTRPLPIEPQTQAVLAEHVLRKNIKHHIQLQTDREAINAQLTCLPELWILAFVTWCLHFSLQLSILQESSVSRGAAQ